MTDEQGETLYRFKMSIDTPLNGGSTIIVDKEDIETVLNILKQNSAELAEKSAEIEKKDKIIDLMAEWLYEDDTSFGYGKLKDINTSEKIKQYFERKVKNEL